MGKSQSKVQKLPGSPNETESLAGDTRYKGTIPRVPKDSFQGHADFPNTPITDPSNSIETCSSKGNETTTGGTHNHSIRIRPEDKISGNKDNRYSNVNTDSAGYSKSSKSTNGTLQTITQVTEHSTIDNNDTGGNDTAQNDQLDSGPVSHHKSDTASCRNVQTANSENYDQTTTMAKEDEKETKKKKKKKKKRIFSASVTPEPSEPKKATCWPTQEENTGWKNKMSVTEKQVNAMTMEAERLAERCRFDIENLKTDDKELILCPKAFIQSISSVEKYLSNLISENSKLAKEKHEYLNRLSAIAGARLTNNNPNITNLHDPDRPMKVAEKFNKIYDDEWTDMIERLEKKGPDTEEHKDKCVYHLYSVLIVIFNSLSKKAEVQLQGLAEHLFLLTKPSTEQIHATWDEYKDERVQLIASRKKTAETAILMLHQTIQADRIFVQELGKCSPPLEDIMLADIVRSEYFKKCVEICWHFVIQDPPMYVENVSLKGTKINKDTHKVFTKSGDIVKYHVWPALYLHQDGTISPLMGKGVVQAE